MSVSRVGAQSAGVRSHQYGFPCSAYTGLQHGGGSGGGGVVGVVPGLVVAMVVVVVDGQRPVG